MPDEPADSQALIEAFLNAVRLRHLQQCQGLLDSLETLSHQQPTLKAWCLFLQGVLAFELRHDWAEAEDIFSNLLQIELELALRERVLYSFGRSLDMQGRWAEAITAFEQIIEIGYPLGKAKAWNHIGLTLYAGFTQGDFGSEVLPQAASNCRLALDTLESITNPSADILWFKGTAWNALGLIHVSLAQWDEAMACYQQDLAICQALDDRHGMGLTYGNLGEIYQKQKNWSEALAAYRQALYLIREFNDRYEEIEALANVAFLYQEMEQYEQALDYYSQAIQLIEELRAGVSSEAAQAGFFGTVVDTYANAILLFKETGQYTQAFDLIERARSRAFLDLLAARSPDLSQQMEARPMTLAEVQAALPPDALLLEYFTTGLVEAQEGPSDGQQGERHRFPPARTLIFAVTPDKLRVYDADISPNDLYPHQFNSVVKRHFLDPSIRRTLYNRLIAPAEELVWDKRRLYIVPHGPLHYIPFQTLIAPDGEMLLREAGPQLVYTPSATLLLRHRPTHPQPPAASCLAIGYNGEGQTQLYFAEAEARSIARLTTGRAITGAAPKKATLYHEASDYRLLHLACHGEFNPESPLDSCLRLAPEERLTALDVMEHLRLQCDLVTLSACESGLSRVRRGDELVGLIRAFMYAGTPALVSTLWHVDDHPTRILMERFYQEIQAGVGFAEALKRAQLYVKNLSHQEALEMLTSLRDEQANETFGPTPPLPERPFDLPHIRLNFGQATAYIRGVITRGQSATAETLSSEPAPDEKVYENPYYWAAFILIGDRGLEALGEG